MVSNQLVDKYIQEAPEWQGNLITMFRRIVSDVNDGIKEDIKWGVPVWSLSKLIFSAGCFKNHVKFTFFNGVKLKDSHNLFNSPSDSKKLRSINILENESISEEKLRGLVVEAVEFDS